MKYTSKELLHEFITNTTLEEKISLLGLVMLTIVFGLLLFSIANTALIYK